MKWINEWMNKYKYKEIDRHPNEQTNEENKQT